MSHSLTTQNRFRRSSTRTLTYHFAGDWDEATERLMQRAMDTGVTVHVEMCRDGLWFVAPPGQDTRDLCAQLEARGMRRVLRGAYNEGER